MKRIFKLITIITAAAMLCACGTDTRKEETMEENKDKTEITAGMSEEDKASFASGIKTEDEGNAATPAVEATSDAGSESSPTTAADSDPDADTQETDNAPEIEERCPADILATRADVKYGEYTHGTYYSETCGLERGYSILLPADYSNDKKYPVLYLLHGIFGNEYSFSSDPSNNIKEIAGNMAADSTIEEMIIVCPDMYATSDPNQKPGLTI